MEEDKRNEIIKKELMIENNIIMENLRKSQLEKKILQEENQKLNNENKELREQLDKILYSRSYKTIQMVKKLIKGR